MRRHFTDQQFRQALDNRSPGIMDERSVAYWDLVLHRTKWEDFNHYNYINAVKNLQGFLKY